MNTHVSELLSAIGPGLCYGLGALALFWLRSLFKSFEGVLKHNARAHEEMLARLNDHETRLATHGARLDGAERDCAGCISREHGLHEAYYALSERISRLEGGK